MSNPCRPRSKPLATLVETQYEQGSLAYSLAQAYNCFLTNVENDVIEAIPNDIWVGALAIYSLNSAGISASRALEYVEFEYITTGLSKAHCEDRIEAAKYIGTLSNNLDSHTLSTLVSDQLDEHDIPSRHYRQACIMQPLGPSSRNLPIDSFILAHMPRLVAQKHAERLKSAQPVRYEYSA